MSLTLTQILSMTDRDKVDLVDELADAETEAATLARTNGDLDAVERHMDRAIVWLSIREELTRAGWAA